MQSALGYRWRAGLSPSLRSFQGRDAQEPTQARRMFFSRRPAARALVRAANSSSVAMAGDFAAVRRQLRKRHQIDRDHLDFDPRHPQAPERSFAKVEPVFIILKLLEFGRGEPRKAYCRSSRSAATTQSDFTSGAAFAGSGIEARSSAGVSGRPSDADRNPSGACKNLMIIRHCRFENSQTIQRVS